MVGGLPATGKSTIARALAQREQLPYLRVDTIEQAILRSGTTNPSATAGYVVAYSLAADQLKVGFSVVVECVNPLAVTRRAWSTVAQRHSARLLNVEVTCSDEDEHRRRAEERVADIPDLVLPTWQQILDRDYDAWTTDRLVLDTAVIDHNRAVQLIIEKLAK